jgi:hypothetical protein
MTVKELNDKMQAVDVDEMVRQSVIQNASKIVTLNRRQLEVGKNAEGQTVGAYRSSAYAKFKKEMGSKAPYRVPDLKLTGAFHKGFFLEVEDNDYYIQSTDEKAPALAEKYDKIFGLTKESQQVAKEFNTRTLGKIFKQATGLK